MSKSLTMAQIGVGNWGKNLLRNFYIHSQVNLKYVCDTSETVRSRINKDYPDIEFVADLESLHKMPDIDAVIIATQADSHYTIARDFLNHGKHVFVEKPMTLNLAHSEELVQLSKQKNKILMVGHILEYHPAFVKAKEIVDKGELGDIYYIYSSRVNLGVVRQNENSLWSFAPHDISVVLMLINSEPEEVICTGQSFLQQNIEDVVFTTIHFANRKMAHLHVSWLDPHKIRKVTIVGSKKMLVVDDMESSEKIRIYDKGIEFTGNYTQYGDYLSLRISDIHIQYIKNQEPLKIECDQFVNAIQTNTPPVTDGMDGLRVVKILTAAQESLNNGGAPVKIKH